MKGLIGYTGFVGSNLDSQIKFDKRYNSKNIQEIEGENFEELYCAGVSAVKWLANSNPEKDLESIKGLIKNLERVKVKKFILISTIDIYENFNNINEDTIPNLKKQDAYGRNRYFLESWVKENYKEYLIVRLPALFGKGLKKNFIYDLMNPVPSIISKEKWKEISENMEQENFVYLKKFYAKDENENYKFDKNLSKNDLKKIEEILKKYGFTSLCFTDTRSYFPFYYLKNLKKDIDLALKNNIKILNLSVEPVTCKEISKKIFNMEVENYLEGKKPMEYDMLSKYDKLYGGDRGYLYSKEKTFKFLKEFIEEEK